jgi:excisionase family DNA binding protein
VNDTPETTRSKQTATGLGRSPADASPAGSLVLELVRLLARQAAAELMRTSPSTAATMELPPDMIKPSPSARLPRLLSVRDVADRFGVSSKTVSRWIQRGHLHVHRLGRQIRIAEEDAATFIAAHRK